MQYSYPASLSTHSIGKVPPSCPEPSTTNAHRLGGLARYSVQCTVHSVQCTVYSAHRIHRIQCSVDCQCHSVVLVKIMPPLFCTCLTRNLRLKNQNGPSVQVYFFFFFAFPLESLVFVLKKWVRGMVHLIFMLHLNGVILSMKYIGAFSFG